jgi:hypothetical protein
MTVTPTLSLRPDAVVLRWIDQLRLRWQIARASDTHLFEDLRELDARTLRDIGLEHLVPARRR